MGGPVAALGGLGHAGKRHRGAPRVPARLAPYGRKRRAAALGLAVSPLLWTYSVIGLSYAAEAALATASPSARGDEA